MALQNLNHTHDPSVDSWVESAQAVQTDFPLQNLPLCVFSDQQTPNITRLGVGIGDQVLDLASSLPQLQGLPEAVQIALKAPRLNALLALGRDAMTQVRQAVWTMLSAPFGDRTAAHALRPMGALQWHVPCDIGDYTDFFASPNHAHNTFNLFRPGQVFLPNFDHLPIAYHGRASSIVISGHPLQRPWGQLRPHPDQDPEVAPSRKLDIEVELGFYIATGNPLGQTVGLGHADRLLAGVSLLNDWSARDIQAFESQPLGPFLSKNFCSSVAPWVVTLDALAPFRAPAAPRSASSAPLRGYLQSEENATLGMLDIQLVTLLQTETMRMNGQPPVQISQAAFARDVCWTPAQMVAHHTLGGCNLRPGDLLGSGTISGPEPGTEGSLLEMTWNGTRPLVLPNGETRSFLHDGDEVTLTAWCEGPGFRRIGLGQCTTRIHPATAHMDDIPAP